MARNRIDRDYLTNGFLTAHTVGANVEATFVEMVFHNTDTSNREVTVYEVPSGGTPGAEHTIIDWSGSNSLRPNEMRGFAYQPNLQTGDFIQWKSDVASKVTRAAFVNEEAA